MSIMCLLRTFSAVQSRQLACVVFLSYSTPNSTILTYQLTRLGSLVNSICLDLVRVANMSSMQHNTNCQMLHDICVTITSDIRQNVATYNDMSRHNILSRRLKCSSQHLAKCRGYPATYLTFATCLILGGHDTTQHDTTQMTYDTKCLDLRCKSTWPVRIILVILL